MNREKLDTSDRGLYLKEWGDGDKRRAAYMGFAAHGTLPGVGPFILMADDVASLEMLWGFVFSSRLSLDTSMVKIVGVCHADHINEMARGAK